MFWIKTITAVVSACTLTAVITNKITNDKNTKRELKYNEKLRKMSIDKKAVEHRVNELKNENAELIRKINIIKDNKSSIREDIEYAFDHYDKKTIKKTLNDIDNAVDNILSSTTEEYVNFGVKELNSIHLSVKIDDVISNDIKNDETNERSEKKNKNKKKKKVQKDDKLKNNKKTNKKNIESRNMEDVNHDQFIHFSSFIDSNNDVQNCQEIIDNEDPITISIESVLDKDKISTPNETIVVDQATTIMHIEPDIEKINNEKNEQEVSNDPFKNIDTDEEENQNIILSNEIIEEYNEKSENENDITITKNEHVSYIDMYDETLSVLKSKIDILSNLNKYPFFGNKLEKDVDILITQYDQLVSDITEYDKTHVYKRNLDVEVDNVEIVVNKLYNTIIAVTTEYIGKETKMDIKRFLEIIDNLWDKNIDRASQLTNIYFNAFTIIESKFSNIDSTDTIAHQNIVEESRIIFFNYIRNIIFNIMQNSLDKYISDNSDDEILQKLLS